MRLSAASSRTFTITAGAIVTLMVAAVLTVLPALSAQATTITYPNGSWYSGAIQYTSEIDCSGIIWGNPIKSTAVMAYTSVEVDMASSKPAAGDTFYASIVVGAAATPCGGNGVIPGFKLPAGVQLDIKPTTPLAVNGNVLSSSYVQTNCAGTAGVYCITSNTADAPLWAAVTGNQWEWLIPLKATTPQNMTKFEAWVQVAGTEATILKPWAPINVFGTGTNVGNGSTPTVTGANSPNAYRVGYPQPSTTAVGDFEWFGDVYTAKYGLLSLAHLYTNGKGGTYYVRRATSSAGLATAGSYQQSSGALSTGSDALTFGTDWDVSSYSAIKPGVKYYWKIGFKPTGASAVIWGSTQSFTGLYAQTCNGKRVTVSLLHGQLPTPDADIILGTPANDVIDGLDGDDTICGLGGNDTLIGGQGHDALYGGDGNDTLDASEPESAQTIFNTYGQAYGNDIVSGGTGTDTVTYLRQGQATGSGGGVNVNLGLTTPQNTGAGGKDTISSVENVVGSPWSDSLTGTTGNNTFKALGGYNTVISKGGTDTIDYSWITTQSGDATYKGVKFEWLAGDAGTRAHFGSGGTAGFDDLGWGTGPGIVVPPANIIGSKYSDYIFGDARANTIRPGLGSDTVDGKGGVDTVTYVGLTTAVKADLTAKKATGGSGTDVLTAFENVTGGNGSDTLTGNSLVNILRGGLGNDIVKGLSGNDLLYGDSGNDTVYGGIGNDKLYGLAGTDKLYGESGTDTLDGGTSKDTCSGGTGTDKGLSCEVKSSIP